jgi:formylglycine-generating enzyme required for sulfatase activity
VQKRAAVLLVVVVMTALVSAVTLSAQSADPWIGTWKVNLEKSTYSPGPKPTSATTIKLESSADGMKSTFDGMTSEGKPFHTEAVGAFDGKDNPVKGAQFPNTTVAYKRIDGRTFEAQTKIDGKPTTTAKVSVSADGKTMTATVTGKNRDGQTVNHVIMHDKQ